MKSDAAILRAANERFIELLPLLQKENVSKYDEAEVRAAIRTVYRTFTPAQYKEALEKCPSEYRERLIRLLGEQ